MTVSRSCAVMIATLVLPPTFAREGYRAAAPPGPYAVTDLGTLGTVQSAQAYGINNAGQVVGYAGNHAFLWHNGVMTDLGTLGGNGSIASAINESGQIVGYSAVTGSASRAARWDNGVITNLTPALPSKEGRSANGINDAGQIVGMLNYSVPFIWQDGAITTLPHLGGGGGFASDINNVVRNLNTLIPSGSGLHLLYANGINNAGQIVGVAYDARGSYHAYLLTPLPPGTPVVNVGDASVTEGHSGTRSASLTVTLTPASSEPVTVSYSTASGSATEGTDYQASGRIQCFSSTRMPFKSQAQRRKFAQLLVEGKISNETFEEWNRETGGKKLPERVSKTRSRKKVKTKRKSGGASRRRR